MGKTEIVTLKAPAKINLTLEVLGKRPDGYHELRSVVQTVSLWDSLHFRESADINVSSPESRWLPEESLVTKAARLLREVAGKRLGSSIEVEKRIPLSSGLGGDSTDAAATLCGLNKLWSLGLQRERLSELAARLGSDVPFFIYGGTALIAGKGETVTPLSPLSSMWVVLLLPPVPGISGKTKQLYGKLTAAHYTRGEFTERLVSRLNAGREVGPSMLYNIFDSVAGDSFGGIGNYRQQLQEAGAQAVHLAGSGPTLFSIMKDREAAENVHNRLLEWGLESYLAETTTGLYCK